MTYLPAEPATLPDELMDRLVSSLDELSAVGRTAPIATPGPKLYHESFAGFGVALQNLITRVETLAADVGAATDLTEFRT